MFMKSLFPRKYELHPVGSGRNPERVGHPVTIIPGVLCSRNIDYLDGDLNNIQYDVTYHGMGLYFIFNFVKVGNIWEIDIVSLPDFQGRATASAINHWLPSDRGGRKICVSPGHEPRTERKAKDLAMAWADLQARYIITGVTPDQQINSR